MSFCIEVKGDYALFTRPEFKVERMSYEVPTPSAVRAIFQAVLWKPAIDWQVDKIEVLSPIKWLSFRRNELSGKIPASQKNAMRTPKYIEDDRQQRAGLMLKDVHYRFHAHFNMTDKARNTDSPQKFAEMFKRRAHKGQCIYQPYLGTRECSCFFSLITDPEYAAQQTPPISCSKDLGFMLYDLHYIDDHGNADGPMFFHAVMQNGVIIVPDKHSHEVLA